MLLQYQARAIAGFMQLRGFQFLVVGDYFAIAGFWRAIALYF
jgi:hypothetical protein